MSRSVSLRVGSTVVVNVAVVFHERRRFAHATLKAIRDVDVELAEHLAADEIMTAARQRVAVDFH